MALKKQIRSQVRSQVRSNRFPFGPYIPRTNLLAYLKGDTVEIDGTTYLRDTSRLGSNVVLVVETLGWDGATSAATTKTTANTYDIEALVSPGAGDSKTIYAGDASSSFQVRLDTSGRIEVVEANVALLASSAEVIANGEFNTIRVIGDNTGCSMYINGELDCERSFSTTFATTANVLIGSRASGEQAFIGAMPWVKSRDGDGNITNHWVIESKTGSTQTTIYDVVGDAHATISGTADWDTQFEGTSYLLDYGWYNSGSDSIYVPVGYSSSTSVLDQALTATGPIPYSFEIVSGTTPDYVLKAPVIPELLGADDDTLFTAGVANSIAAATWQAWEGDQFFGMTKSGKPIIAVYDSDQTGTLLGRIQKFFSITPEIVATAALKEDGTNWYKEDGTQAYKE